jgi:CheY-like chemotaxis protein
VPKILVADDNTNIQKMVSLAFEERGIDVVSVGNGEAAVRRIPDMNPDLVLADIFMPVRNGYEVCEFVKKDSRFSHVPVILLVGAFDPLDEKEARRVGADGVLKKPFVPPDPLIAMVISALEKNPKVAAELARAKEPPPPEPVSEPLPALEMPVKAEIKPLPDFPEPSTPEEAALVYGFGSGKRGDEGAAAEAKGPISLDPVDADEEEDAHASGAGSTSDWRRNAMDFEIPEETSKNMAFAMDDDAATQMFPSEKDVPPKHVSPKESLAPVAVEAATQIAPAAPPVATATEPVPALASALPAAETVEPHDSFISATMWGATAAVAPAAPAPAPAQSLPVVAESVESALEVKAEIKTPAPSVLEIAPEATAKAPEAAAKVAEVPAEEPALEIEAVSEPAFAARATHWMDAMTAAIKDTKPAEKEEDWSDSLPPVKLDLDAMEPEPARAPGAAAASVVAPVVATVAKQEAVAEAVSKPEASATMEPSAPFDLPVASGVASSEEDDKFFADDSALDAEHASELQGALPIPTTAIEAKSEIKSSDPELESDGPVALGKVSADPELIKEVDTSGPIAKDPALVEPPAVRVKPEPLLLEEEPAQPTSSLYTKREEPIAPAFAFTEPPPVAASAESNGPGPGEIEEPVKAEADERIPTAPPPNREILATIPFLTPPPDFLAAQAEEPKPSDQNVDDVVRKVLEKLEPQLHELLSQGLLKPLVENILHNDLAKKGR